MPSSNVDPLIDTNCTCENKFRLGVSEHFSKVINSLAPNTKPISTTPYSVLEDALNEFPATDSNSLPLFPNENKVLTDMKNDYELRFCDVIQMRKKNLTSVPDQFHLNKDISLSMNGLEQKIAEEKSNQGKSQFNTSQIKKMEDVLTKMKGEVGEHSVYSGFKRLWHGKRGVFIHSFQPEDVLSPLTKRAKSKRDFRKKLSFNKLEKKLSRQLNIDVTAEVTKIMTHIKATYPGHSSITEAKLLGALKKELDIEKKYDVARSIINNMSKLMGKADYTFDEAKQAISVALTHYYFKPDGELDFLAILPDEKLIFNIEAKQQISPTPRSAKRLLKDASTQMTRNEEYLARVCGPMLSTGWRMVKVAVVLPGNLRDGDVCDHCKKFLIDESSINNLEAWWKQSSLENARGHPIAYNEFLKVMELVVPTKITSKITAWTRITGRKNHGPINAGYTENQPSAMSQGKSKSGKSPKNNAAFDDALQRVHDAEKLLFFSSRQLDILSSSQFSKVILWGDYGTGKSMSNNLFLDKYRQRCFKFRLI